MSSLNFRKGTTGGRFVIPAEEWGQDFREFKSFYLLSGGGKSKTGAAMEFWLFFISGHRLVLGNTLLEK